MCAIMSNLFQKHPKKVLLFSYIFSILMIVILHAALTTITTRALEKQTNILAEQLSHTPNFLENDLKLISNYPAHKVVIYDRDLKQVYQSNENNIVPTDVCYFMDYIAAAFLPKIEKDSKNALSGQFFSQIIWSAKFNNEDRNYSFMKVLSPISIHFNENHHQMNQNNEQIYGVLEVYYDITSDWRMYNNTRFFGFLLITIIFFIFYSLLEAQTKNNES